MKIGKFLLLAFNKQTLLSNKKSSTSFLDSRSSPSYWNHL